MSVDKVAQNQIIDLLAGETNNELAIASTDTAYTTYFALPKDVAFGCQLKLASGGTIDVKVDFEESNDVPATDKASDTNWGVGETVSAGIVDANTLIKKVTPVVAKYGRFKLTGQGSNAASTKITRCLVAISRNS